MIKRTMLAPQRRWNVLCPYSMNPHYITVHNTYNDAPADNEARNVINNSKGTSFHWAVDDKEAVNLIPMNRNAWHAGDGARGPGNRDSIAVEICYSLSGGPRFDKAEENAAQLVAELLHLKGWGLDRVRTHKSWSGKYCPHRTLDRGWGRFMKLVEKYYNGSQPKKVNYDVVGQRPWDGKSILWKQKNGYRLTEWETRIIKKANDTIRGRYGNGGTRRIRLGGDYNSVQAEINKRSREGLL